MIEKKESCTVLRTYLVRQCAWVGFNKTPTWYRQFLLLRSCYRPFHDVTTSRAEEVVQVNWKNYTIPTTTHHPTPFGSYFLYCVSSNQPTNRPSDQQLHSSFILGCIAHVAACLVDRNSTKNAHSRRSFTTTIVILLPILHGASSTSSKNNNSPVPYIAIVILEDERSGQQTDIFTTVHCSRKQVGPSFAFRRRTGTPELCDCVLLILRRKNRQQLANKKRDANHGTWPKDKQRQQQQQQQQHTTTLARSRSAIQKSRLAGSATCTVLGAGLSG